MKKCPVSEYCGGCQYQGLDYNAQLSLKQESVEKLLSSFHKVEKIIGCKDCLYYRNKVQISFAYDEKRRVIAGYYIPGSHMIVPIDECMIADRKINSIISSIKKSVLKFHVPVYDERAKKGFLRHVLIRSSVNDEYMVVLVTGSGSFAKMDLLVRDILKYNPDVKTVVRNINNRQSSMVLGDKNIILHGNGYITDRLCGLDFRISPSSFYQVNRIQTEVLYDEAIRAAGFTGNEVLMDAYCGTGTIGLCAAEKVKEVIGVELNGSAVIDAKINCRINGIENAKFICDDAGRYMESLSRENVHIDTVIMDPPRAGSDTRFLSSLVSSDPDKVVYVSCNPVTLKRDLKYLSRYYSVEKIQPVDMFPMTDHVECVVLLKKIEQKVKR